MKKNISFGNKAGVHVPTLLMPRKDVNLAKWSVVACDQYTSQLDYWKNVEAYVDDSPSTLHMIFPEVYLEKNDDDARIEKIGRVMKEYMNKNILVEHMSCFILVDRKTSRSPSRKGLVLAVDLEQYDYNKGSQTLIRATEGTVIERLPPRIKIRQNAPIELPHIMLLIDDPEKTVIEPIFENIHRYEKLYDFDLMMDGGHITGYKIEDEKTIGNILASLEKLADENVFRLKYGVDSDKGVLLFAVGDGNHSLATAKACWDKLKENLSEEEKENHPSRFALVEVVNVHDEGLAFEPIHRVVFNVDSDDMLNKMVQYFGGGSKAKYVFYDSKENMLKETEKLKKESRHVFPFIAGSRWGVATVENPASNLEVGTLQTFLDEYVMTRKEVKIDYIHGENIVDQLGSIEGNIGFYLPAMNKSDLFKTVIVDGVLPRKTFSMGEAEEKRFYLECRKIK